MAIGNIGPKMMPIMETEIAAAVRQGQAKLAIGSFPSDDLGLE